jgi:hypothetical protein
MTPEEQIAWLAREHATVFFMTRGTVSVKVRDLAAVKGETLREAIEGIQRLRETNKRFHAMLGLPGKK